MGYAHPGGPKMRDGMNPYFVQKVAFRGKIFVFEDWKKGTSELLLRGQDGDLVVAKSELCECADPDVD